MNKLIYPIIYLLSIFFACNQTKQQKEMTLQEKLKMHNINRIDLLIGDTPKEFSAKTTNGTLFNSKDYKGKFWIIFVYDKNYLTKSKSYDMVEELNQTYKKYGDKIPMIGLIDGFSENELELKKQIENSKILFNQIDNTQSEKKNEVINDNVFCNPAKILIDPDGKVVYNFCGGYAETFNNKLDSLVKANKF